MSCSPLLQSNTRARVDDNMHMRRYTPRYSHRVAGSFDDVQVSGNHAFVRLRQAVRRVGRSGEYLQSDFACQKLDTIVHAKSSPLP